MKSVCKIAPKSLFLPSINFGDVSSTVFIGRLYCHGNSFLLWGILRLGLSLWEILAGNFLSRDFWGFVESPGDFGGFGFLSPFDHPGCLEYTPLGLYYQTLYVVFHPMVEKQESI